MSRRRNRGQPRGQRVRMGVAQLLARAQEAMRTEEFAKAQEIAELILRHQPDNFDAWFLTACLAAEYELPGEERRCLERVLQLRPDHVAAATNLSALLWRQHDAEGAAAVVERTLPAHPDNERLLNNYGNILRDLGRYEEAVAVYDRALATKPDSAEAVFNQALTYLMLGQDEPGWRGFERRWDMPGFRAEQARPHLSAAARWDGQPVPAGQRLLLWAEQGAGDTLQMLRWVRPAAARCAERPVLEVQPELLRLCALALGDVVDVVARGEPWPPYHVQLPLMSLAPLMDAAREIPTYTLPVTPIALPGHFRLGLCWAGSPAHPNDRWRSASLEVLAPLLDLPGVTCYSLQVGPKALPADHADPRLVDLAPHCRDFLDSAELVAGLDLVVAVDTATAHLAGALGVETWLLVAEVNDYRWRRDWPMTPWYPRMQLWRQRTRGDWADVVGRMEYALIARLLRRAA